MIVVGREGRRGVTREREREGGEEGCEEGGMKGEKEEWRRDEVGMKEGEKDG